MSEEMFFRFGSALVLVVLISLVGTALEKRNLKWQRALSRQHYQLDELLEQHAALRVTAQQLGAPQRLLEKSVEEASNATQSAKPAPSANPAKTNRKANTKNRQKPPPPPA